jgi:hypothetical protein
MGNERVRPIAICVFRDGQRILCPEGYDSVKAAFSTSDFGILD